MYDIWFVIRRRYTALHYCVIHRHVHAVTMLLRGRVRRQRYVDSDDDVTFLRADPFVRTDLFGRVPLHFAVMKDGGAASEASSASQQPQDGQRGGRPGGRRGGAAEQCEMMILQQLIAAMNESVAWPTAGQDATPPGASGTSPASQASPLSPLDVQSQWGQSTALHEAIRHKNAPAVRLLLQSGADPLLRNKEDLSCQRAAMLSDEPYVGLSVVGHACLWSRRRTAIVAAVPGRCLAVG